MNIPHIDSIRKNFSSQTEISPFSDLYKTISSLTRKFCIHTPFWRVINLVSTPYLLPHPYESKENFFSNSLQSFPKPSMTVSAQQCALISSQLLSHALCLVKAIIFLLIKPNVLNYQKPSCTLIIFMCHGEVEQKKFLMTNSPSLGRILKKN